MTALLFLTLMTFATLEFNFILLSSRPEEVDLSVQESLLSNVSARLSPEQASLCEGYLTVDEVFAAVNGMAKDKALSSDGFPM